MPNKKNRVTEPNYALDMGGPPLSTRTEAGKKAAKRAKSLGQARREMKGKDYENPRKAIKRHMKRVRKGVAYS